jgi:uncharacterized membrane protein
MNLSKKTIIVKIAVFILILVWFLGIVSPILFPALYPISKLFYSHVCHQNDTKTIHLFNRPLLVCARCMGIYSGAFLSSVLLFVFSTKKIHIKYLFLSALPVLIDVALVMAGLTAYSKYLALITGLIFGSITFLYIWNGIEKLLTERG